jgi:hypothetical protein
MTQRSTYYKRCIPEIKLSIEKGTKEVPNDGKYYLLVDGQIVEKFTLLKKAEGKFKEFVEAIGYKPKLLQDVKPKPRDETIDRYMIAKSIFWAEGPKYRDKRGRGGRGGV